MGVKIMDVSRCISCAGIFLACIFLLPLPPVASFLPICYNNNIKNSNARYISRRVCQQLQFSKEDVPSLYQEQEKMLVARGELEATLMLSGKTNNCSPLEASRPKGVGAKGGFGGGGGDSSRRSGRKAEAKAIAKVLKKEGVVRLDNVLKSKTADEMRGYVYDLRAESEALAESGEIEPIQRFADVLLKKNRCDLKIPLDPDIVNNALRDVLLDSAVGPLVSNLLGDDAILYELSCLMSDPGSQRQVVHPDTPCSDNNGDAVLYTCFIALQDVELDMGPTLWLPRTNTKDAHVQFSDEEIRGDESVKDAFLRNSPGVLGLLPKGSCGIFDSRTLHCGGANQSSTSRALFYFSFKNPTVQHVGNPGSIRDEYIGQYSLSTLTKKLKARRKTYVP